MRSGSLAAAEKANLGTDEHVGISRQSCRPFVPIMRIARQLWRSKVPEQFAAITGKATRSCERWLAGHVDPDGPSTLMMMTSEPAFLEATVDQLSPQEQRRFWAEIERRAKRQLLRIKRAELDEKIRQAEADIDWRSMGDRGP